ncbi:RHS repeat domain-containing protein [Chitinophaga nivalis]|uniref:RHS repeat protein n=1 Tax=Chitinophaga nivalis TaxID=2991709 RepID=A0ABT3IST8_9BACT|nr:RHS repeat domain-containing protein [Chitinophaga nivalis]MCW3463264.1 RHS repeat protein [Chitinophaga nivalis]MCW3487046.1 RHS repeat protein [Chitinophaga nivalis]
MKNIIYCLLIPIFITACSTNKNKRAPVRLAAIGIKGESIPQYTFRYDAGGHLVAIVQYLRENDTSTISFRYDAHDRLTSMVTIDSSNQQHTIRQQARITAWDEAGNITAIQYYDGHCRPTRTAKVAWKGGWPSRLKYSDSSQAISWDSCDGNAAWKDLCTTTPSGKKTDTNIVLRSVRAEWDRSESPLRLLANQMLLGPALSPVVHTAPFGYLPNMLLYVGANNPTLVKITEKEKSVYPEKMLAYERSTTLQYFYDYHDNGYPATASVHLHTEGYTKLSTDTRFTMDYTYE